MCEIDYWGDDVKYKSYFDDIENFLLGEGHENDLKYFNSQYVEYNFEEKESKDIFFCFPKKIWEKGKERVKKVKKTIEKRTIKNIKVKKSNNDIFCIKEN